MEVESIPHPDGGKISIVHKSALELALEENSQLLNSRTLWRVGLCVLVFIVACKTFRGSETKPVEDRSAFDYHTWDYWGLRENHYRVVWKKETDTGDGFGGFRWLVDNKDGTFQRYFIEDPREE